VTYSAERVEDRHGAGAGGGATDSGGELERVTVHLTPRASRALELLVELTGDSKTDAINRALQVYAFLEQVAAQGGGEELPAAAVAALQLMPARAPSLAPPVGKLSQPCPQCTPASSHTAMMSGD
jgi:hypothetical protein